jgi:hypothetical protein
VTFDLIVWPVARQLSTEEALAEVERFGGRPSFLGGHDKRLDPFIAAIEARYPGIRRGQADAPCEFDVMRDHIFLGIAWSRVEEVVQVVAEAAWRTGVAVYDPQREAVGLPAPFANAPMTSSGVEPHVAAAEGAAGVVEQSLTFRVGEDDPADFIARVNDASRASGFTVRSPLGFEITPDIEAEVAADPGRLPTKLQTPDRKSELLNDLSSRASGPRHQAIGQLAAWDPDPEVAAALRPMLLSDDVFEASQAATGLARQGDITDFPALLDLVHRMSPADGGTFESMLLVLPPALDLAGQAGPVALEGLQQRARQWRGDLSPRAQPWHAEAYRAIDALLDAS